MGSGTNGPRGLDGFSSLEITLDRAIAERFASVQEQSESNKKRRSSPMPTALALTSQQTTLALVPARLSWRGVEVSDEFQDYAARVARGERLAPYRGIVLSRYTPSFPWGGPFAPMSTTVPTPTLPKYPERGRPVRTVLSLVAAVASIAAALSVGAGATSTTADGGIAALDPVQATAALTPTTALGAPPPTTFVSSARVEAAPVSSLEAELAAPPPVINDAKIAAPAVGARQRPARVRALPRSPGVQPGAAPRPGIGSSPEASRSTPPAAGPLADATTSARGGGLAATVRPVESSAPEASSHDSTLFSLQPSF
jgi:hypothetical protein